MLKLSKFTMLAVSGILLVNAAHAEDKSAALVNGVSIPQSRIDIRVKAAVLQGQADSPELRKAIREDMVNLELMAQEADKTGLNKDAAVQQQIDLAKQSVLASALMQNYLKSHPVTDEQMKQEYDKQKTRMGDKEYNAHHILVKTEEEAKSLIAQIGKGAKFDKLAEEKSLDSGSAKKGGALGWALPSDFVPPFAQALQALKKGEYTKQPVQSQFGWHIIKLDDVRSVNIPAFDKVKPQISQHLQQQTVLKFVTDLRAKAKIE
jgi:peptidyl-prolyl cis-trans isomerase C